MKHFSLILLILIISLSGCSMYGNTRREEYESAVIAKDSEVTKYMPTGKGGLIPYHNMETRYYLYVMNPLETTGKDVKMSVGRTIWENTDVALKGNKGLVGER